MKLTDIGNGAEVKFTEDGITFTNGEEVKFSEDGITFTFDSPEAKRFVEDLFENSEDDESEDLRESAYDLIENLAALANALAESLKCQIDDGYSISEFVTQSELLCEILDFFKEYKNVDDE